MTEEHKVCAGCDYVIDTIDCHYTPAEAGPSVVIARESLNDPDQTLLLEKRLSFYEGSLDLAKLKNEQQKERIAELENSLRRSLCSEGY